MINETIGNYRLVRELGSGGMGTVYEAVDVMLERRVAIKMLRPEIANNPDLIGRFRSEAVTLAKLNHPAVATLFAFVHEGGRFAMVMEYVPGRALEALLEGAGRLQPALAAEILRQTLDGVAHAHSMGVLHRDIKPANIMITDERVVKVTDFGIARILGSSHMTREGKIIGTIEYIAPERVRGEAEDHRCDLYSAGVVLYELLAGRLPFVADTDYGLLQAHLQQNPPELSALGVDCPAKLQSVLRKALAKSPNDRFQSAQEFRDALSDAVGAAPALKPTRLAEAPVPARSTRTWALAGTAMLLLLAAGVGTLAYMRSHAAPAAAPTTSTAAITPGSTPAAPQSQQSPQPVFEPPVFLPPPTQMAELRNPPASVPRNTKSETVSLPPAPVSGPAPANPAPAPPAPVQVVAPPEIRAEPEPAAPPKPVRPKDIRAVHRLYIEKMADELDSHIKEEIRKQMPGLSLLSQRSGADAIMKGSAEKHDDTGSTVTRGYLGIKSTYSATVRITDAEGVNLLWSAEAGDSRALIGAFRRGGPKKVAERIVENLKKAMER